MTTQTIDKPKTDLQTDPLSKFDAPVLKEIGASALGTPAVAFLPQSMAEAMELAKLMAASNFVPPHLRGKPGDCLAVVMQSTRWEMDPFAVAGKTYFVNDRMAYEAQLVVAVLNSRAPLVGRLEYEWIGSGQALACRVSGLLRGDPRPKVIDQEIGTIKTKNSPLWQSSPRQQLGYYTARMWARLHCPEVLMGIYTLDEISDAEMLVAGEDGSYSVTKAPPRPTRDQFKGDDRAIQADADLDAARSGRMPDTAAERGDEAETTEKKDFEIALVPVPDDKGKPDWKAFSQACVKSIATLPDIGHVEAWAEMHHAAMQNLKSYSATMHANLETKLDERRAAVRPQ